MKKANKRIFQLLTACLLLFSVIGVNGVAQMSVHAASVPGNPLDKPGWILDVNDEFNGSTLNTNLWIPYYLQSRTTKDRAAARYHFDGNGHLVLRIDPDQPTYYSDNPMKVSSIQTGQMTGLHKGSPYNHSIPTIWKYTPQYGYFEIRAKTSPGSGYHSAFWMVGTQGTSSQNAEIDIIEDPGNSESSFLYNLHKWSDPNVAESSNTLSVGFNLTSEFHIYALEWTPTQLKLYVDNALKKTIHASPAYSMVFLLSIYENAGWTGTVDPSDTRPKEFVIDYFRGYHQDPGSIASGATYKIKNADTGKYLDSDGNGAVIVAPNSTYDDQDWIISEYSSGLYTIKNARTGRYYLNTDPNNVVIWDNGGTIYDDMLWSFEPVTNGFRINNHNGGREYLYATSTNTVLWNTGSTDSSTVWSLEKK